MTAIPGQPSLRQTGLVSLPGAQRVKPLQRRGHALHPDLAVVDIYALIFGHLGAVEDLSHDGRIRPLGCGRARVPR
jgi:hypothetical protein